MPGCARCADSREALRKAAQAVARDELIWRDLDVIEHMDYAVTLGVLTLPAVAINGRLVFIIPAHTGPVAARLGGSSQAATLPWALIRCRRSSPTGNGWPRGSLFLPG